ncbi:ABC transporter ATP-binding protein [Streptomyces sp. AP-93]|uniref:ABC transporter ATP-binding protein n=1 Tax=Streptomyces sp. AP-93 TaxID=2929048 RepID=UPI001FAEB458|nr:ABC transporter ATP-binding protein [Streptomyces sp. AP-93]MCJ0874312.1 ABC transporter ATP-binding protein [Streptomyces sp. AP-93]
MNPDQKNRSSRTSRTNRIDETNQTCQTRLPALRAVGLGHRYPRGWALRDCTFQIPAGRVCALVGPNGAGKSTLMSLAADLLTPTEGSIRVFGAPPEAPAARRSTALLSQDKPLHRGFRVAEILRMGSELNPTWDQATAERVIGGGNIPHSARVGSLSGGQRTRVALALAFGKRPRLLMLDEPMADLDPLVRHEMAGLLLTEAAAQGTTVLLSSHVVSELEGACDFLLVIGSGRVRLAGDIDELRAAHRPGGDSPAPSQEQLLMTYLRDPDLPTVITPAARPEQTEAAA